jgi:uncharacterized protein YegJ (DUF2314 family)
MLKLLAHIAVALVIWFALAFFGVGIAWRLAAIALGAVAIHQFWERVLFNPFLCLGAMPVSSDDPLMQEARRMAAASMPTLRRLFPEHPKDTSVRFGLRVKSGKIEHVWGDLLELADSTAKVFLRTPPTEEVEMSDRTMSIPVTDIDDWQIEFTDGTLRGGFTNRALFKIFEREQGYQHPKLDAQIQRYKDA